MKTGRQARTLLAAFCAFVTVVWSDGVAQKLSGHREVAVSAAANEQRLRDVMMVIDNSGSMKRNDPGFLAKSSVHELAGALGKQAHLGIVLFADRAELVMPLSGTGDQEYSKRLEASLAKVDYSGSFTDIPGGIEKAIYELKTNGRKDAEQLIVFMTDGKTDLKNRADIQWRNRWLTEGLLDEAKSRSIRIFGIAFTDSSDFNLIQTLTNGTGGEYFRYVTAKELQQRFSKEILQRMKPVTAPVSAPVAVAVPNAFGGTSTLIIVLFVFFAIVLLLFANIIGRSGRKKVKVPEAFIEDVDGTSQVPIPIKKAVFRLGRDPENDFCIEKDCVSAVHATIEYRSDEDAFHIKDQRSTNRTFVNDKPVNEGLIKGGDIIGLGTYKIRFKRPGQTGRRTILIPAEAARRQAETENESPLPEQAILVDVNRTCPRHTYSLTKRKTGIGRAQRENDICIPDAAVSSFHAEILYEDGTFFVRDKRSSGGTFLNGMNMQLKEWEKIPIKWGDEIIIAPNYRLRLSPGELYKSRETILGTPVTEEHRTSGWNDGNRPDACPNHPEHRPDRICRVCGKWFCGECVEEDSIEGGYLCSVCKREMTDAPPVSVQDPEPSGSADVAESAQSGGGELSMPEPEVPDSNDGKTIQKPLTCARHPGNRPKHICSVCKRACCEECVTTVDGRLVCSECSGSSSVSIIREKLAGRLKRIRVEIDGLLERMKNVTTDQTTEIIMSRMLFEFAEKEIVKPFNEVLASLQDRFPQALDDAADALPVDFSIPETINPGDLKMVHAVLNIVTERITVLLNITQAGSGRVDG